MSFLGERGGARGERGGARPSGAARSGKNGGRAADEEGGGASAPLLLGRRMPLTLTTVIIIIIALATLAKSQLIQVAKSRPQIAESAHERLFPFVRLSTPSLTSQESPVNNAHPADLVLTPWPPRARARWAHRRPPSPNPGAGAACRPPPPTPTLVARTTRRDAGAMAPKKKLGQILIKLVSQAQTGFFYVVRFELRSRRTDRSSSCSPLNTLTPTPTPPKTKHKNDKHTDQEEPAQRAAQAAARQVRPRRQQARAVHGGQAQVMSRFAPLRARSLQPRPSSVGV
jgi:hypothetical protein